MGLLALAGWPCAGMAKDGPKSAGEGIVIYEARYGAWTVSCDPCVAADDSVCAMWPDSETAGLSLYPVGEESAKPLIGMSYHPGGELAYLSEGSLSISVDGGPVTTIAPPDVSYNELYGSMFVESHAVAALLPAMRDGTVARIDFVDADGMRSAEIPLSGFGIALDDMLRRLPYPRGTYEPGYPNSCPY